MSNSQTTGVGVREPDERPAAEAEAQNALPRASSLRAYVSSSGPIHLVIATTVFAMFLPALIVPYAFSDDYSVLWMIEGGEPSRQFGENILDASAITGRPLAGLLDQLFFSAAGTIDNLRFVRLFAVVGIVALALLLHWALVRSGIMPTLAALIALLVCSMPAFQVYGSWTVLFSVPYAALLAGGASLFVVAGVDAPRNLVADRLVGATMALLAALLIYQPAAMFFWVFFAVALVGARHESTRALRLVRTHLGVAAVALALAFLVLRLSVRLIGETATGAARSSLTHDLDGKVRWFFEQPLYRSLNLFDLTPTRWLAALVATVAAAGILLWLLQRAARPLLYALIAVLLIPLSYLPNLVVRENWASFRTQVSISSLIALYACLGAIGMWLIFRDWLRPRVSGRALVVAQRVALVISGAFVAASVVVAAKNVTTYFVEPQSTELRMLRSQVAALPAGATRISFVQTGWHQGMTKLVVYDEFGLASTVRLWALEPSLLLILREQERLPPRGLRPIVELYPFDTVALPRDQPVVDLRGLQRLR